LVERIKLTKPASNGGKFQRGNQAALGNRGPERKRERYLGRAALHYLLSQTDPETGETNWLKGWRRLFRALMDGNVSAARVIFDYGIGAPRQQLEVSTAEFLDEIPEPTMQMSLKELSANYQRRLRARRRPEALADGEINGNGKPIIELPALPPNPTPADLAAQYAAMRIASGRKD
jgi:hypothetical protein